MTDENDSAPPGDPAKKQAIVEALTREHIHRLTSDFARRLVDRGFDRVAVARGLQDTCEDLRDDALAEATPGGNA